MLDLSRQTTRADGAFGKLIAPPEALEEVVPRLRAVLASARTTGDPVIWVLPSPEFILAASGRHADDRDAETDPEVGVPEGQEPLVLKDGIGGFAGGRLDVELKNLGIEQLVLVGIATQYVVAQTAAEALELGYRVVVAEDCCVDVTPEDHAKSLDALRGRCVITTSEDLWSSPA
jgi:nicotinamidase-related amidase